MQKPKFTLIVIVDDVGKCHELLDFSSLATAMGVDELIVTQGGRKLSDIIDEYTHSYPGHVVLINNVDEKPRCEHSYLPRAVHPTGDTCLVIQDAASAHHLTEADVAGVSQVLTLPKSSRGDIFSIMSVYFYDRHIKSLTY